VTEAEALAFVEQHGVVLVSAQGAAPKLVDAIAGEPVRGSWWGHPRGKEIFRVLSAVQASPDILVCRLLAGKLTLVHRRLWPALVRLADRFAPERIARVREEHTASGKHVNHEEPFPAWVPAQALAQAERMAQDEAERLLGPWAPR
jgi:hypothetical protein